MRQRMAQLMIAVMLLMALMPLRADAAGAGELKQIEMRTQSIELFFDGKALSLPDGQYSFIYADRTYVPIRYMAYALLKQVDWDGDKFMVTVSNPTQAQLTVLKEQLLTAAESDTEREKLTRITVVQRSAVLKFDGEVKPLPEGQSVFIHDGTMYVPLRFLAESAGMDIGWDDETRTVTGASEAYKAEHGSQADQTQDNSEDGAGGVVNGAGADDTGANGGGSTAKPTYEAITSDAQARLEALSEATQAKIYDLGWEYLAADETDQPAIKAQVDVEVEACTAEFETILVEVTEELESNGYSTDVIVDYRTEFQRQMDEGRALADSLM